ncbi:MAG: LysM peptidoglycan-binding domain-containing protein [Rectinemataceae bacterium]
MRISGRTGHGGFAAARPNHLFAITLSLVLALAASSAAAYDREGGPGSADFAPQDNIAAPTTEALSATAAAVAPVDKTVVVDKTAVPETQTGIPAAEMPPVVETLPAISAPPPTEAPAEAPPKAAAEVPPEAPNLIVSAGILVDGLQYDLTMPWGNESFENYRESYLSSGGRKWLAAVMEKSLPYIAYVEERVEFYGLPRELAFLPVVESEYSPQAVSGSGATGLWQFMRNSIAGYGMAITDWVDERQDFMKSTDGALRKLADNFRATGDWDLALAAYNAGLGTINRAIKSCGDEETGFWELAASGKLGKEPRNYVPKFLAVASILRYPELHGLPAEWGEKHDWETLETDRQVDLALLAERAGIPLAVLRSGNAELRYQITPPVDSHMVKVPAEKAEAAKAVLEDRDAALVRYNIHKVKSGDTLSAIAKRYGTPLSMILQANSGLKADKIRIGQTIMVPILQSSSGVAATSSGVAATSSGVAANSSGVAAKSSSVAANSPDFTDSYTIRSGDTLWEISLKFGIQPETLADHNGLTMKSVLRIGQKLKVPSLN